MNKTFFKKIIAIVCAAVIVFSAVPLMSFAEAVTYYTVLPESPALPLVEATYTDLSTIKVSFDDGGTYKHGVDVEWALKDTNVTGVKISDGKIFAFEKGAYILVATDKSNAALSTEVVAVVAEQQNGPFNIFDFDFANTTAEKVNGAFGYQSFNSSTTASNTVSTVPASQLTVDGFVNKAAESGKTRAALFVKDISIIGKFKDYTVKITQKHAVGDYNGGGILARALMDAGKINTANNNSVAVVMTRFNTGKDTAMLFAGATQILYPGNSATSTDFAYDITANKFYDMSVKFSGNDFGISLADEDAALTQVYNLSEDAGISAAVRNIRYKARYGGTVGIVRSSVDVTVKRLSVSLEFTDFPEMTSFKMIKASNPIINIGLEEDFDYADYYIQLNSELVKVNSLNLSADDKSVAIDTVNNKLSGNAVGLFCITAKNSSDDTANFYLRITDTSITPEDTYTDNGNYVFTVSSEGVITGYAKKYEALPYSEKIVVPTIYDSVVVKEIAANLFKNTVSAPNYGAAALKCVVVAEGIEKIGDSAFNGGSNIEKVVLPISLKNVVQYAFGNTKALQSITVFGKETVIADTAFNLGNAAMIIRSISDSNAQALATAKGFTFENIDDNELEKQQAKANTAAKQIADLEKAIIETVDTDAVYKIILDKGYGIGGIISVGANKTAGKYVLPQTADYTDANSIVTPNVNVVYVAPNALKNSPLANRIHALTIPEGYTNIGGSAFIRCDNLKVVSLPSTLTTIASYAFYMDKKLTDVKFDVELSSLESIGEAAFQNTGIKTFKVPFSVKSIAKNAFADSELSEVWIYNAETVIGENAFPGGTVIHGISGSFAEEYVLQYTDKNYVFIADVTDKLNQIISTENTDAEYKIILDKGYGIGGLISDGGNKSAGKYTLPLKADFTDKNGVLTQDVDVVYVAPNAFYKSPFANSLYSVVIPEGYTTVSGSAFAGCANLRVVSLPTSLTTIASYAFSNDTALYSVSLDTENSMLASIGEAAFNNTKIEKFKIPFATKTVGKNAFANSALNEVWIYNKKATIGDNAFPAGTVIHGVVGSTAEAYVKANTSMNYAFKADIEDILEQKLTTKDANAKFTITKTANGYAIAGYSGNGGLVAFPAFADYKAKDGAVTKDAPISLIAANLLKGSQYASKVYAVEISEGITTIQDSSFINCSNLMRVKLPTTLCAIDGFAFQNCALEGTVTLYQDCAKIGKHAFYANPNLEKVYIYNKTCEIGEEAIPTSATIYGIKGSTAENYAKLNGNKFVAVQPLPEKTIDSVADNGNYKFIYKNDTVIIDYQRTDETKPYSEKVVFPGTNNGKTVTKVEGNIFKGKPYSNSVVAAVFSEGIAIIGDSAFVNCARLRFVKFPNTLTAIMPYAFQNTPLSGDIVFPEALETISANAFSKCANLRSVTISNPTCEINNTAFEGANEKLVIYGLSGSTAEKFAILHKFEFVSIGEYKAPDDTSDNTDDDIKPDNDKTKQPASSSKSSLKIAIIIAVAVVVLIIIIIVFIIVAVAIKNKNDVLPEQLLDNPSDEVKIDNSDADLE